MAKRKNGTTTTKKTGNQSTALQNRKVGELGEQLVATPFTLMRRFGEEMDRMFGDFGFGRDWLAPVLDRANLPRGLWSPQVEMFERDNQLMLRADLPGLTKDDVDVEFSNDGITIEGERKNEHEEKGEGYFRSERSYGRFFRRVPVPEGVDIDNAKASFDNGVLEITMPAPKREERKPRRLEIGGNGHTQARGKAA
jgi:HSP20 family protein